MKDVCKSACEGMTVISAGVCVIKGCAFPTDPEGLRFVKVSGESRSLNTTSRKEDGPILTDFLFR